MVPALIHIRPGTYQVKLVKLLAVTLSKGYLIPFLIHVMENVLAATGEGKVNITDVR
jgi:hypothetical protein